MRYTNVGPQITDKWNMVLGWHAQADTLWKAKSWWFRLRNDRGIFKSKWVRNRIDLYLCRNKPNHLKLVKENRSQIQ